MKGLLIYNVLKGCCYTDLLKALFSKQVIKGRNIDTSHLITLKPPYEEKKSRITPSQFHYNVLKHGHCPMFKARIS